MAAIGTNYDADDELSQLPAPDFGVQGCGLDPDYATNGGFCKCLGDWASVGDGTCKRPCWRAGQQIAASLAAPYNIARYNLIGGTDECWPTVDATDDTGLPSGCVTSGAADGATPNDNWNHADYYCECDNANGWITQTNSTGTFTGYCSRVCLVAG